MSFAYPKSTNINGLEQKVCVCHCPNHDTLYMTRNKSP